MLELKKGFYPPGGYRFTETDGTPFEADDMVGLVNKVWGYRRRAGLPAENTWRDVNAQICSKCSELCQEVEGIQQHGPDTVLQGKVSARAAWLLNERMQKRLKLLTRVEADIRFRVCVGCKFFSDWVGTNCPPCQKNIAELLSKAVEPEALHEGCLGKACRLAGDDLSAEVWVKEHKTLEEAPDICWRKSKSEL